MALRWRRLLLYGASLLLALSFGYVAMRAMVAVRVRYQLQQELTDYKRTFQKDAANFQRWMASSKDRLDPAQLWQMNKQLQWMQAQANVPSGVNHSYAAAIAEAVLTPWSSTSSGTITWAGTSDPYPGPRELYTVKLADSGIRWLDRRETAITRRWVLLAGWLWLLLPLSFVVLPVSRRRAKVRWAHLGRVTGYGSFVFFSLLLASLLLRAIGVMWESGQGGSFAAVHLLWRWVPIPMLMVWWWAATSRYLCLPHGWAVVGLLSVLCALLFLAAVILLVPWLLFV